MDGHKPDILNGAEHTFIKENCGAYNLRLYGR